MLKKAKWIIKEAHLRFKYMTAKDCIFCQIVRGEIKSKPVFENDKSLAINDVNPVAQVHILIFPKNHIESVLAIKDENAQDLVEMFKAAKQIVSDQKLDAFRLVFNGGRLQHVPHLHMHLLAGRNIKWEKL